MTPERQSRLNRQANLGADRGMRLRLTWESGFSVTVHSWQGAGAIVGRSGDSLRQYWFRGKLAEGLACPNPDTGATEQCFFTEVEKARRGSPVDPSKTMAREKANNAKRDLLKAKLVMAEARVETLKAQINALP